MGGLAPAAFELLRVSHALFFAAIAALAIFAGAVASLATITALAFVAAAATFWFAAIAALAIFAGAVAGLATITALAFVAARTLGGIAAAGAARCCLVHKAWGNDLFLCFVRATTARRAFAVATVDRKGTAD